MSPTRCALRAGSCIECGSLVQQHFDLRNRWIGCAGARRINQAFQASPKAVAQPVGALELVGGPCDRDGQHHVTSVHAASISR